ncbi:MAG TPA: hypothetical protein VGN06_05605 [Gaiellaceae bacterium]
MKRGLLLVVLLAAGCGGGKSPSIATLGTTTTTSSSASGQAPLQQDALKYAECMRSNGVPSFPDPNPGGGFTFHVGAGGDPSSPAFEAAQAKCQKLMPIPGGLAPGSTTHPSAQWLAQMEKAAQCMRRHGIPAFPDPRTSVPSNPFSAGSRGGVISNIQGAIFVFPDTIDMQSPAFVHASAVCKFPLHNH